MKPPAMPLLVAMALGVVACSRSIKLDNIPVERYTAEASGYKLESGVLTTSGFTPSFVQHLSYGPTTPSPDEVRKVSGHTVVTLAAWNVGERYVPFKRSGETVTLNEIPYVFVDP